MGQPAPRPQAAVPEAAVPEAVSAEAARCRGLVGGGGGGGRRGAQATALFAFSLSASVGTSHASRLEVENDIVAETLANGDEEEEPPDGALDDAQSRTVIGLWKVNLEEPKSHLSDPSVIIHDISTKTRIRLASANENDKQQFQWFSNACKGIPQARPAFLGNNNPATAPPTTAEDIELAVALSSSLHSASQERPHSSSSGTSTNAFNLNGWSTSTNTGNYNGWDATIAAASPKVRSSDWSGVQTGLVGDSIGHANIQETSPTQTTPTSDSVISSSTQSAAIPSAPPVLDESLDEYPISTIHQLMTALLIYQTQLLKVYLLQLMKRKVMGPLLHV